jgi:hypothetical protein
LIEGDLTVTSEAESDKDKAIEDLNAIRSSLRSLLSIVWSSVSSEGTSIFDDLLSIIRLALADAAELIEGQAGSTKESLRSIDTEVRDGTRDTLGRDKKRLEEEKDSKVAWQHGMDTVKDVGTSVIGTAQSVSAGARDKADKTSSRLQEAFYKVSQHIFNFVGNSSSPIEQISDRAQSDPEYRQSLDTLFDIIQKRLNSAIDAASDPKTTLSNFIADPTPEQHIPKALGLLRTLLERLANTSLEPLIQKIRICAHSILKDQELKAWFDDFFSTVRKNLSEPGYARSEEAQGKRKELRGRWGTLLEKSDKWRSAVDNVMKEAKKVEAGIRNDEDLNRVREAHAKLGSDIERGLVEAGQEAQTGMQAAVEQATWFWQDLFKVYLPRIMSKMRDIPIPRLVFPAVLFYDVLTRK